MLWSQKLIYSTHFKQMFYLYTAWKRQKTNDLFSGGIKLENWLKMGSCFPCRCPKLPLSHTLKGHVWSKVTFDERKERICFFGNVIAVWYVGQKSFSGKAFRGIWWYIIFQLCLSRGILCEQIGEELILSLFNLLSKS